MEYVQQLALCQNRSQQTAREIGQQIKAAKGTGLPPEALDKITTVLVQGIEGTILDYNMETARTIIKVFMSQNINREKVHWLAVKNSSAATNKIREICGASLNNLEEIVFACISQTISSVVAY